MDAMAQRFAQACDMADFGIDLQAQRLRRIHLDASEVEIGQLLQDWLLHHPGAEFGDAPGPLVTIPRHS